MKVLKKKVRVTEILILTYPSLLFSLLLYLLFRTSLVADEGTHLLLSAFYRDLFFYMIKTRHFSFSSAYSFGIDYLVTYPKLQVAYPPVYHLTTGLVFFSIIGKSYLAGRICNFTYFILTSLLLYKLIRKFFNRSVAILSLILWIGTPFSFLHAFKAMKDFTVFFWLFLSIYIYIRNLKRGSNKLWFLLGFILSLTLLSERLAVFSLLFFLSHYFFILKRGKLKPVLITLLGFSILTIPYSLLILKLNLLRINYLVGFWYGEQQGEPTSYLDPYFWLWYLFKSTLQYPLLPALFLSFVYYVYKKEKYWKELLLWFLIFYFGLSTIPNKEPRFSLFFLLPTIVTTSFLVSKNRRLILLLLVYLFVSIPFMLECGYLSYPSKKIATAVYDYAKEKNGNVAMFSEGDPLFSSVLMWHLAEIDKERKIRVLRACAFENKTTDKIMLTLRENNVRIIVNNKATEIINPMKLPNVTLLQSIQGTEIFEIKGKSVGDKRCNYICLTREEICSRTKLS